MLKVKEKEETEFDADNFPFLTGRQGSIDEKKICQNCEADFRNDERNG